MKKDSIKTLVIQAPNTRTPRAFPTGIIASRTGYPLRTVNQWADGKPIPKPAQTLLAVIMLGWIPAPGWQHFRLMDGKLWNLGEIGPKHFDPYDLAHLGVIYDKLSALRDTNRRLQHEIDSLRTTLNKRPHTRHWPTKKPA